MLSEEVFTIEIVVDLHYFFFGVCFVRRGGLRLFRKGLRGLSSIIARATVGRSTAVVRITVAYVTSVVAKL